MKKKLFLVTFTVFMFSVSAQYEAAHWFFGSYAGLNFTSGVPVAESGSQINTEEGCSSISNACGDLLLYTDGIVVWNANHQVMQNGTGLKGDPSSTQSGIVVPKPNDKDNYYVFTVDAAFSAPSSAGLQYSLVDMTLDGGLGAIVTGEKNIQLVDSASEKVTAVMSSDDESVWVITLAPRTTSTTAPYVTIGDNMNTIYAFKITASGVQLNATVTTLPVNIYYGAGYMKASPDGKRLAIANMEDNSVYLLDFNDITGAVSNPVSLQLNTTNYMPYGLEFSPNSTKLYISDKNSALTQFDLSDNNKPTIISTDFNYRSALQLGLDGKIYQTFTRGYGRGSNLMSVIEKPNEAGLDCNYNYQAITLPTDMEVHQGLPPFIQSYFVQIAAPDVTAEFENNFEVESNEEISNVDWDFGDGATTNTLPDNPPNNTHAHTNHTYDNPGTYTVTATIHLAVGCDVVVTKLMIVPDIIDTRLTTLCLDPNSSVTEVDLHQFDDEIIEQQNTNGSYTVKYYISEEDALNDQNEITGLYTFITHNDQLYYAITNIATGVTSYGTFYLIISEKPEILPITPYEICDVDTDGFTVFDLTTKTGEILDSRSNALFEVAYFTTQTDAQDGANAIANPESFSNTTSGNQQIWYRITNKESGCFDIGSFELFVYPLIDIDIDEQYLFCIGHGIEITAPSGFVAYQWSTGETTPSIWVNQAGEITLTVTNDKGCTNSKSFKVDASDVAKIQGIDIKDFSEPGNNAIIVYATGIGNYEYSIDGTNYQDSNMFLGLRAGEYIVYVADKNACGIVTQPVVILNNPRFFTPNGDGYNDVWQIDNISTKPGSIIKIYNRFGKLVKILDASSPGWDGTFNGQNLPPDDYWFVVEIKEADGSIRQQKGHFSLER